MEYDFNKAIEESCAVKKKSLENNKENLNKAVSIIVSALSGGKKILIFGNGGSAADAQHVAAEFVVRLKENRRAYPAIALTTDTSILTSCGNDLGFDLIFSRQIEALGSEGDAAIAISTSGNSKNVILAVEEALKKKIKVIGLTGRTGGKMKDLCDIVIRAESENTMRIQETHITLLHALCDAAEQMLKEKS